MTGKFTWIAVRAFAEERLIFGENDSIDVGTWVKATVDCMQYVGVVVGIGIADPTVATDLLIATSIQSTGAPAGPPTSEPGDREGFGEIGLPKTSHAPPGRSRADQDYRRSWQATLHPGARVVVSDRTGIIVRMLHQTDQVEVQFNDKPELVLVDVPGTIKVVQDDHASGRKSASVCTE